MARKEIRFFLEYSHIGEEDVYEGPMEKHMAIHRAKELAASDPDLKVYISWFRPSDHQRGYLNRDGYAITGSAW